MTIRIMQDGATSTFSDSVFLPGDRASFGPLSVRRGRFQLDAEVASTEGVTLYSASRSLVLQGDSLNETLTLQKRAPVLLLPQTVTSVTASAGDSLEIRNVGIGDLTWRVSADGELGGCQFSSPAPLVPCMRLSRPGGSIVPGGAQTLRISTLGVPSGQYPVVVEGLADGGTLLGSVETTMDVAVPRSIYAHVKDAEGNQPLAGVTVVLERCSSDSTTGNVLTDGTCVMPTQPSTSTTDALGMVVFNAPAAGFYRVDPVEETAGRGPIEDYWVVYLPGEVDVRLITFRAGI